MSNEQIELLSALIGVGIAAVMQVYVWRKHRTSVAHFIADWLNERGWY